MAPPKGKDLRKEGKKWIDRISGQTKIEKDWFDDASRAVRAYTDEEKPWGGEVKDGCGYDFNILYANVETIVPAVINSPPVPDIRRRFNDADPAARIVADILERAISVQIDDSRLQVELEAAAQDSFLAGRGLVRIRYKSDIVGGEPTDDELEDATEERDPDYGRSEDDGDDGYGSKGDSRQASIDSGYEGVQDRKDDALGLVVPTAGGPPQNEERVENERICFEAVSWRDYRHGPAKRWEDRSWDAFRFIIPKDEGDDTFPQGAYENQLSDVEKKEWVASEDDICGWEVWCKRSRKVKFIDDNGIVLKEIEDPLGLPGFFPIPTPMQPIELTGRLLPTNPFKIYRRLADELDTITKRIRVLADQMKVKGFYSGSATDLENLVNGDDNDWIPIQDSEVFVQNGGMDGAISYWPIERFIAVLKELYVARDQVKQAIYEITGISDIVRGATMASETATAQNIKSQWGSLRIQKMQRMLERHARDLFVMMASIIPAKFSPETLQRMTSIPIVPSPNDDPETLQQKLQVLELLKQPLAQMYRIDVESDSTVRADLTRQKQEVAEFLQGAAAYFQAVGPLVQQGALPADAATDIFASTARMFNLGKSVEDTLEKMVTDAKKAAQQPKEEKPDPEMVKAQMEGQKMQMQAQIEQSKAQTTQVTAQAQIEAIRAKLEGELSALAAKTRQSEIDAQTKIAETNAKMQAETQSHAMEMQKGQLELVKLQAEIEKIRVGTAATVATSQAKADLADRAQTFKEQQANKEPAE